MMAHGLKYLLLGMVLLAGQGCYIPRVMEQEVPVKVVDNTDLQTYSVTSPTYLNNFTKEEYHQDFLDGLNRELESSNLIPVSGDSESFEYMIEVKKLILSEELEEHTVEDEDSEYHGQTYTLSNCDASLEIILYKGEGGEKMRSWSVSVSKDEKVTNNRNVVQLLAGTNKDNNTYRLKSLDEDVFKDLMGKLANRTNSRVSTKVYRDLK